MPKDRTFQNKVNRVQGDLELMISKAKAEKSTATWKERYCGLILELNDYAGIKCDTLKEYGIELPPDYRRSGYKKSDEPVVVKSKLKPPTSQRSLKKISAVDERTYQENMQLKDINADLQQQIAQMERDLNYYYSESIRLKERVEEAKHNENMSRREKEKLHEQKEMALNRLSQVAGSRLKAGNPSIADLSDTNRPTSLSMQLSELYSNEWTNAFEVMADKGEEEREIIDCLLNCITNAYTECQKTVECDTRAGENKSEKVNRLRNQSTQQSKPALQSCVTKVLQSVWALLKTVGIETDEDMLKYVDECVKICWWMCVQDPPLDLIWDLKHGIPVDTNAFTFYTRSGKYVDYVVWPVLYLHKHGPILGKGVLQGCN